MAARCEKRGCEKQAVNTLRFTDTVRTDLDSDYPVVLCEDHAREVQRFAETDVAEVQKWLNTVP